MFRATLRGQVISRKIDWVDGKMKRAYFYIDVGSEPGEPTLRRVVMCVVSAARWPQVSSLAREGRVIEVEIDDCYDAPPGCPVDGRVLLQGRVVRVVAFPGR